MQKAVTILELQKPPSTALIETIEKNKITIIMRKIREIKELKTNLNGVQKKVMKEDIRAY